MVTGKHGEGHPELAYVGFWIRLVAFIIDGLPPESLLGMIVESRGAISVPIAGARRELILEAKQRGLITHVFTAPTLRDAEDSVQRLGADVVFCDEIIPTEERRTSVSFTSY